MATNDLLQKIEWQYLAEGNSSIVYSCVGTTKVVLRVKKHYATENVYYGTRKSRLSLENNKLFIDSVLKPLFKDDKYFVPTDVVLLSDEDRRKFKGLALATKSRPDKRRHENFELSPSAMLMPHLGFYRSLDSTAFSLCSYAVEIKPKWGFLPKMTTKFTEPGVNMGFSACRFCIHQYLKMKTGEISSITSYCPLDLFARCSCRLKRALKSLFQEPQNNLRFFHNGTLVYSGLPADGRKESISSLQKYFDDVSSTKKGTPLTQDTLIEIVSSILIHDSWQGMENQLNSINCTASSTPICKTKEKIPLVKNDCFPLGKKGILRRLVEVQKLSTVDASTIKSFIKCIKESCDHSIDLEKIQDFTSRHWECFISRIEDGWLGDDGSTEEFIHNVQKFLVSATFKDCSIMITFTEHSEGAGCVHEDNIVTVLSSSARYAYSIKLIDLDPKQIKKMDYYEQLDHDILEVYREYFKNQN